MKKLKKIFALIFILILLQQKLISEEYEPIELSAHYINETGIIVQGGKEKGAAMMGRGSMKIVISTEKLGLWNGGFINLMGNVTHGNNFSATKIGDYQVASNIDAGDHTYIHELFYQQDISNFTIKFGVQDLNVDFLVCESSSLFLNSSFGVPSVISHGIPAPIYPLTAMGIVAAIRISDDLSIKTSIYDGLPISFENNPYNTNWHINDKHGFQFFNELAYKTNIFNQKTTNLKFGFYHHTGIKDIESNYFGSYSKKNGYYFIIDQEILDISETQISLFSQFTFSPSKKETDNNLYIGLGGLINNPVKSIEKDYFGLALAYSKFNTINYNYELAIEMFYNFKLCKYLFFQPDIQYIINPGGNISEKINNTLVVFVRFILEY